MEEQAEPGRTVPSPLGRMWSEVVYTKHFTNSGAGWGRVRVVPMWNVCPGHPDGNEAEHVAHRSAILRTRAKGR